MLTGHIVGNFATLPLNAPVNTAALMLDARGWPVAGASVTYTNQNGPGDTGIPSFSDGSTTTTRLSGEAVTVVRMTSTGRARFKPTFNAPQFAQLLYRPSEEALARLGDTYDPKTDEIVVPRYRALARKSIKVLGAQGDGLLLKDGPTTAIAVEQLAKRQEGRRGDPPRRPLLAGAQTPGNPVPGVSRVQPRSLGTVRHPLVITSCAADLEVFSETGVSATQINLPFTVTLTDLSPSTGQSVANGPVNTATGIHGHRIRNAEDPQGQTTPKQIRLKIDIKDSTGDAPAYPVLVNLSLGGPWRIQPGTLILDPDGARLECPNAAFIWHERDAQGNIIALNEEIEYRYGLGAVYVGAIADPQNPGHTKPVWGATEAIDITLYAVDPNGDPGPTTVFNASYDIHPEPVKPDHFYCVDDLGNACSDTFRYWTGYRVWKTGMGPGGQVLHAGEAIYDTYTLADRYGNTTFGYTNTAATQPASNVTVNFSDQTTTGPNFCDYAITTDWTNDPAWPAPSLSSTLRADYPTDPDWQAGDVTKTITLQFDSGTTHVLSRYANYDRVRPDGTPGYTDGAPGTFPIAVAPGATTESLPKTDAGDGQRLVLLAYAGETIPQEENISGVTQQFEPYSAGTRTWRQNGASWTIYSQTADPHLELTDRPSFKLSLIDDYGKTVTTGAFQARTCPRFDHESAGQPCTDAPVGSNAQGLIDSITLTKGYLGLELTKAPTAPGGYYVLVESLGSAYRIRRESDFTLDRSVDAGEFKGAFALCVVQAAEILDQNFQRTDPIIVEQPTQAYVRMTDPSAIGGSLALTMTTYDSKNLPVSSDVPVTLTRLGSSSTFVGPVVFAPDGYTAPQARTALSSPLGPYLFAKYVVSLAQARRGGSEIANRHLNLPAQLKLEYLDANGVPSSPPRTVQVTRVTKEPEPSQPWHSLYYEDTLVRVTATDPDGHLVDVDGVVRLDEEANAAFPDMSFFTTTPNWQFSYQKDLGVATDLRPTRTNPGDFTAVALTAGKTDTLRLRSLAGPRMVNLGSLYSRYWDSTLYACEAKPAAPCSRTSQPTEQFKPGTTTIKQWVDQQAYSRHSPGAGFSSSDGENKVTDWMEAVAWDVLSEAPVRSAVIDAATACVSGITAPDLGDSLPSDGRFAETYQNHVTKLFAQHLDHDAFRWDEEVCEYNYGFRMYEGRRLTNTILHEARHCWQWDIVLSNRLLQDQDLDYIPTAPDAIDPLALRLKDDPHVTVGGTNPEAHFAGSTVPDVDGGHVITLWDVQRERDATYFEQTATAGVPQSTSVTAALTSAVLEAPASGSISVRVGATSAISVRVIGDLGVCDLDPNTRLHHSSGGIAGLAVEVVVSGASTGISVVSAGTSAGYGAGSQYVAETDATGVANMTVTGNTVGSYTLTLTARQIVPAGNALGGMLRAFSIPVEVTP